MNLLSEVLSGSVSKVIDSVANGLDKLFTSDEERMKAEIMLQKVKSEVNLELQKQALEFDKEITERWKSDNEHMITRLVRPSIVVWCYLLFTIVILLDGNIGSFKVNSAYIPMLQTVLATVTLAYFGSRGAEKITRFFKKGG